MPTRNESLAVASLLERLQSAIDEPTEVIFVDDSNDTTPWNVRQLAESREWGDLKIRLVHRTLRQRRGGLGSAVCEGIRQARGYWVCVLDADLQHPPELVADIIAETERTGADLVIASRYTDGGSNEGLTTARRFVSRSCALAAKTLFPLRLRRVTDPLSGFFLLRRDAIDPDALRPHGFKILLEILVRNPQLQISEVGFTFGERYAGMSKSSLREGARYAWQLGHLRSGRWVHRRNVDGRSYLYDIHGILSVQSDTGLPELEKFRVRQLAGPASIRVDLKRFDRRRPGELIDLSRVTPRIHYDEAFGHHGFSVEVERGETTRVWASPTVTRSPHVLYTNIVEPILRWQFVEMGYALVHAACFIDDGDAHFVTARTDTGKTTTMLKILELGSYGFLSDDLTLIDETGQVLTYPKPLTISNHTVHALQSAELDRLERLTLPLQSRLHSKKGREFAIFMAEKNLPVATINAVVQRLIPPPKYHIERLVPGAPSVRHGRVRSLNIIQRGDEQRQSLDAETALDILSENCEDAYGFPPYAALEALLQASETDDLRHREREIVRSAFENVPAMLFTSPSMGWAETIHEHLLTERTLDSANDQTHISTV